MLQVLTLILVLLIFILLIIGLFDLLVVLLSYSITWYEHSNTRPELTEKRMTGSNLRLIGRLFVPEVVFNFVTLLVFPLGMINRQPELRRGIEPVLLLNGLFDNQASWFWFKHCLRRNGISNIVTVNLSSWHSEEVLTELLAKQVDEMRLRLGVNRVSLVGHSMGGIIARNYVQLRGGEDKVARLICLGSPHRGSKLASFSMVPLGKLLIPGSDFLQRLNAAPPPQGPRTTNIYTRKDNMVLPNSHCRLEWAEEIELDNMGHTSLIYRRPAIDAVVAALQKEGEQCSTV